MMRVENIRQLWSRGSLGCLSSQRSLAEVLRSEPMLHEALGALQKKQRPSEVAAAARSIPRETAVESADRWCDDPTVTAAAWARAVDDHSARHAVRWAVAAAAHRDAQPDDMIAAAKALARTPTGGLPAIGWCRRAAARGMRGHADAVAASIYMTGEGGLDPDPPRAAALLRSAVECENPDSDDSDDFDPCWLRQVVAGRRRTCAHIA